MCAGMDGPVLIASNIYRASSYGKNHPLRVPRVSTVLDLCTALGWLPPARYVAVAPAEAAALARFHDADYLAALARAEACQRVSEAERSRFRIGIDNNPLFPEMFRRPASGAAATIAAAQMTRAGGAAFVPGGGTHHGRRDRASGFCYLNDPVLGILAWLDAGLARIAYVDIDAHHGDGVQDAFAGDARVLVISVHEAGRWPRTGDAADRGGGNARNFPVPAGLNDSEMRFLLREAIVRLVAAHAPDAIMLQAGADGLAEDPQSHLALSNNAHREVLAALRALSPRLIVTGGGGYNPWSVARCWTCLWADLAGYAVPARLPPEAEAVLRGLSFDHRLGRTPPEHWFTTLHDPAREGIVRPDVTRLAAQALEPA